MTITYGKFTGLQSVLNAGLGKYHAYGFKLLEISGGGLALFHGSERVTTLTRAESTISMVRRACQCHLDRLGSNSA